MVHCFLCGRRPPSSCHLKQCEVAEPWSLSWSSSLSQLLKLDSGIYDEVFAREEYCLTCQELIFDAEFTQKAVASLTARIRSIEAHIKSLLNSHYQLIRGMAGKIHSLNANRDVDVRACAVEAIVILLGLDTEFKLQESVTKKVPTQPTPLRLRRLAKRLKSVRTKSVKKNGNAQLLKGRRVVGPRPSIFPPHQPSVMTATSDPLDDFSPNPASPTFKIESEFGWETDTDYGVGGMDWATSNLRHINNGHEPEYMENIPDSSRAAVNGEGETNTLDAGPPPTVKSRPSFRQRKSTIKGYLGAASKDEGMRNALFGKDGERDSDYTPEDDAPPAKKRNSRVSAQNSHPLKRQGMPRKNKTSITASNNDSVNKRGSPSKEDSTPSVRKPRTSSKKLRHLICNHTECTGKNEAFLSPDLFRTHLKDFHGGEGLDVPWHCSQCPSRYGNRTKLVQHVYRCHSEALPCEICGKLYPGRTNLRKHMEGVHSEYQMKPKCKICNKALDTPEEIDVHEKLHLPWQPFHCVICEVVLTNRIDLSNHVRENHEQLPFPCNFEGCNFSFPSDIRLRQHVQRHHVEKKHKCPFCPFLGRNMYNLKVHSVVHTPKSPFHCKVEGCGASFPCRYKLVRRHMLEAHGIGKTFDCTICSKSFLMREQLKNHEVNHTQIRAYMCEICSATYKQYSQLLAHRKRHEELNSAVVPIRRRRPKIPPLLPPDSMENQE